jgi:hypothetical protein
MHCSLLYVELQHLYFTCELDLNELAHYLVLCKYVRVYYTFLQLQSVHMSIAIMHLLSLSIRSILSCNVLAYCAVFTCVHLSASIHSIRRTFSVTCIGYWYNVHCLNGICTCIHFLVVFMSRQCCDI